MDGASAAHLLIFPQLVLVSSASASQVEGGSLGPSMDP